MRRWRLRSTATPTVPPTPPPSTTVVITGIATDDPIDGATVELSDTSRFGS